MRARGWLFRIVLGAGAAGGAAGGCWSDRAPTSTTPTAAAATPAQPPPRTSGFRFASSTEHRCAPILAGTFERLSQEVSSGLSSTMLDEMIEATIAGCRETRWDPALLTCLDEASNSREAGSCMSELTPEQESDMKRRFEEVLQRHQSSTSPPPPPPSPPTP